MSKLKKKIGKQGKNNLVVRFSKSEDQKNIYTFYQENKHKHIDIRKAEIWNERAKNGRVLIVEDKSANIGFLSVAYDFYHKGKKTWIELGSTINQQDPTKKPHHMIKGTNLYSFIHASQAIHEFLTDAPKDKIIQNVYDDNNETLIALLKKRAAWNEFKPDKHILKACKSTKNSDKNHPADRIWFTSTTNTLPIQARLVLDVIDKGTTTGLFNKVSGENIKLDVFQFSLANEFRTAVETLAYGPFAQFLENSPHMGMKRAHDHLAKHYPITTQLQKMSP